MDKKVFFIAAAFIFETYSTCSASNYVDNEIKRLKDVHGYQYRHCTSPECRRKIDFLYEEDVKQLKKYPTIYIKYGSLLDEEVKKKYRPDPDVVRYCKKRYRRDPYMREICIKNRTE